MRKVLVLAALLLSACAQSERLTDDYGNVGYDLACIAHTGPGCERAAKKLCPNGYVVLDEQPDHGPIGVTYERTILCRTTPPPPETPPAAGTASQPAPAPEVKPAPPAKPPASPKLPFRQ
jgi:hypothetical protein